MIEIRDVSKTYGSTVVVDGVSLTLPKGGLTAIIGPNGAGKSTLLSMVARLLPMDSGQVMVDGLDVARTPGDALARRLAFLRQDNHMVARLTVRDLVTFGRYPYSRGRPTREDQGHVERSLGYLGLTDLSERYLDELSGGQRQRAFVAMVLCQDTDYMLFDEPLNNLDIRHAVGMMKLLKGPQRISPRQWSWSCMTSTSPPAMRITSSSCAMANCFFRERRTISCDPRSCHRSMLRTLPSMTSMGTGSQPILPDVF